MKKNSGFTYVDSAIIMLIFVVFVLLIAFGSGPNRPINNKKNKQATSITNQIEKSNMITVVESGYIGGCSYLVFEDKITKIRIFHYRDAMVVLPLTKE